MTVAFAVLALAAPAAAQDNQETSITQSCNAGDGGDANGSDGDSSSGSDGGSCESQRRVNQSSDDGDVSQSITQRQSVGGDDDRVRTSRDRDRDRDDVSDEDDFVATDDASAGSDELDCPDFSSQADAQDVLDEDSSDPNNLDSDDDDRACEDEFTQAVSGAPEGGVETGGGGTLVRASSTAPSAGAEIARIAGPALALALVVAGVLGLRRRRAV